MFPLLPDLSLCLFNEALEKELLGRGKSFAQRLETLFAISILTQ